jgi:hypothetical protein
MIADTDTHEMGGRRDFGILAPFPLRLSGEWSGSEASLDAEAPEFVKA